MRVFSLDGDQKGFFKEVILVLKDDQELFVEEREKVGLGRGFRQRERFGLMEQLKEMGKVEWGGGGRVGILSGSLDYIGFCRLFYDWILFLWVVRRYYNDLIQGAI